MVVPLPRILFRNPTLFSRVRGETVRKVREVPETRAHKARKPSRSAHFGPDTRAKYTPGASPEPLFGQFRKGSSRKFTCRILHKTSSESREDGVLSHSRRASRDYMFVVVHKDPIT